MSPNFLQCLFVKYKGHVLERYLRQISNDDPYFLNKHD